MTTPSAEAMEKARYAIAKTRARFLSMVDYDNFIIEAAAALDAFAAEARADQKERDAKIADSYRCGSCGMDGKAATAIREQKP